MACVVIGGPRTWSGTRDSEGHREYKVIHLARGLVTDGPAQAMNAVGLPRVGSRWAFGTDLDIWAWCRPERSATVHQEKEGDPNVWWKVESTFSTKVLAGNRSRCQDDRIESPLLEPQRVSGSSETTKDREEAMTDLFGRPVMNSAFELLKGDVIAFDRHTPKITIEQNVAILNAGICYSMVDTLNIAPLWGIPARCIKLSNFSWERKYYGLCYKYYTRKFEFDVDPNTFDRIILDEGTKVLKGHWSSTTGEWILENIGGRPPNPNNPAHFMKFKDKNNEYSRVILNGAGLPAYTVAAYDKRGRTYLSLRDFNFQPLHDTSLWIPVVGPYDPIPEYDGTKKYVRGNLVKSQSAPGEFSIFVATVNVDIGFAPPLPEWHLIGPTVQVVGTAYEPLVQYNIGDIINVLKHTSAPTVAGFINVQKYLESNFLLLGIPAIF